MHLHFYINADALSASAWFRAVLLHGQRPAVPRFADEFVRQLERYYTLPPRHVIPQLKLPNFMVEMLWDTYCPEPADRRLVERLRMDLLGRTPLGCGRRLAKRREA